MMERFTIDSFCYDPRPIAPPTEPCKPDFRRLPNRKRSFSWRAHACAAEPQLTTSRCYLQCGDFLDSQPNGGKSIRQHPRNGTRRHGINLAGGLLPEFVAIAAPRHELHKREGH